MNELVQKLLNLLKTSKTVVVSAHINPDGDAVGASFALSLCLKQLGLRPIIVFDNYPERYNFLEGHEMIYYGDESALVPDLFIALDCATKERLGSVARVFDRAKNTINIDHHISNNNYAALNYVQLCSSTCELIYPIINQLGVLDRAIASALYAGIILDTGGFRHNSTTISTMNTAASLMSLGIPFNQIYREVLSLHSLSEAKIFGRALSKIKLAEGGKIAYSLISQADLDEAGASYHDLDGIVEYLLNMRGVEAALSISERGGGEVKASMRSLRINVERVAAVFSGGGHVNAAGATLQNKLEDAVELIIAEIKKQL